MIDLKTYFEVKPFKDQSPRERYAYLLHRISFPVCIIGSAILVFALLNFSIVFVNYLMK